MERRQVLMQGKDIHSEGEIMNDWRTDKPKKEGEYLTTITGLTGGEYYIKILYFGKPVYSIEEVKGRHWYYSDSEYGDVIYDEDVVAWRELPEPYTEGESNE